MTASRNTSSLESIAVDLSWSFADKTQKDTGYVTHSFHRYPAKFIPQLANRLIREHCSVGDTVADVFAGCGTTLVEAKMLGRKSVGLDISKVACLITEAKITPIAPPEIESEYEKLVNSIDKFTKPVIKENFHERIHYWFRDEEAGKLKFLLDRITNDIKNKKNKNFFLCAFSNTLKGCSIWNQKSNKPHRDINKKPAEPFYAFNRQVKKMIKGMDAFYTGLADVNHLSTESKIHCTCSKDGKAKIQDNSVDLIVTSPPYVTSYEYADLHQLSSLWLGYTNDLSSFRKDFVGSAANEGHLKEDDPALRIVVDLQEESRKLARSVAGYFFDMKKIFTEMHRILKVGGKAAIVIGNTKLRGVDISNAEVFLQYMELLNMKTIDVIKREIPSKNIPSVRDPKTGRFSKTSNAENVLSYPTEYILLAQKQ